MWSSFTIESPDPPAVVRDRLAAALTPAAPGWLSVPTTFRGEVRGDRFRVTRNFARLENSTVSIVATGRIRPVGDGTSVEVATRPQWPILIVSCVWTATWVQLIWRRLMYEPLPGGIDWCEMVVLIAFAVSSWFFLFASCAMDKGDCQRTLTQVMVPTVKQHHTS